MASRFCTHCGQAIIADNQFCGGCGAKAIDPSMADDDTTLLPPTPETPPGQMATPAGATGQFATPAGATGQFAAPAGTTGQFAAPAGATGQFAAAATPTSHRTNPTLLIGVAVVIVGLLIGGIVFAVTRGGDSSAVDTIRTSTRNIARAQGHVNDALSNLDTSTDSFLKLRESVNELDDKVQDARDSMDDVKSSGTDKESKLVRAYDAAVSEDLDYVKALADVTSGVNSITDPRVADLERTTRDARDAWSETSDEADAIKVDLKDVEFDDTALRKLTELQGSTPATGTSPGTKPPGTPTAPPATRPATNDLKPEMRIFLQQADDLMAQSSQGRSEIVSAISAMDNGCTISPETAANSVDNVARNRQRVLEQVNSMSVPNIGRARTIHSLMQSAIEYSVQADFHYGDWMRYVNQYYYTPPTGCPNGAPPHDGNYSQAVSDSNRATSTKQRLVGLYNPLARNYGLGTWSASEI